MTHTAGSGVSSADFPNIASIVRNRNALAANRRADELQPGAVKAAEQTNDLNAFSLRQNQRTERSQETEAQLLRDFQDNKPGAGRALAFNFPEKMTAGLEALAKQRDMKLEELNTRLMAVGRTATAYTAFVTDPANKNLTPAQKQAAWDQGRSALVRRFPEFTEADVPLKPNSFFLKSAISTLSSVAQLIKQGAGPEQKIIEGGTGKPGETRKLRVNVKGPEGPVAPINVAAVSAAGKGADGSTDSLPAGISNTIFRVVNNLFGDIFDLENNVITVLDPEERKKMIAVAARAEQIAQEDRLPALQAVQQAAREFNIAIPERPGTGENVNRARPGAPSETRSTQLKAFADFVDKLE